MFGYLSVGTLVADRRVQAVHACVAFSSLSLGLDTRCDAACVRGSHMLGSSLSWDTRCRSPCVRGSRVFAFVPANLSRVFLICEVAFGWCRCVSFVRTCLSGSSRLVSFDGPRD